VFRVKAWARGLVWIRHWPSNSLFLFLKKKKNVWRKRKERRGLPFATPQFSFLNSRNFFLFPRERRDWL